MPAPQSGYVARSLGAGAHLRSSSITS